MSDATRKRVLSVGQCGPDHQAIRSLIESTFSADVEAVEDIATALERLGQERIDLVLVNRVLDANADDGIALVHQMQGSDSLRAIPVMLVSNFETAQTEATAAGAAPGFGKVDLHEPATRELLAKYLA